MSSTIQGRIIHKHDTQTNWQKATNFIPIAGELIGYDVDGSILTPRLKMGNGTHNVNDLPFINRGIIIGTVDPNSSQGIDGDIYIKYE